MSDAAAVRHGDGPAPDEWGLTPDEFGSLTKATRAADELFESGETGGGGTRHWLRDCFLPALEAEGLVVRRV